MSEERKYWLDDPRNVNKIVYSLYVICALLLLADFFYEKHDTHLDQEHWIGFYAFYGLIAYTTLVLTAKSLRKLLKRKEDYYGE